MTVRELIDQLRDLPDQDAEVVVVSGDPDPSYGAMYGDLRRLVVGTWSDRSVVYLVDEAVTDATVERLEEPR